MNSTLQVEEKWSERNKINKSTTETTVSDWKFLSSPLDLCLSESTLIEHCDYKGYKDMVVKQKKEKRNWNTF